MSDTEEAMTEFNSEDVMKILVATDIHLGYNEKHSLRGNDSFIAFEEILQNAVKNEVDFILLGGDLFHDAKPSPNSLQKCMKLLRTYTLGDKPIAIEFLSDQSLNFQESLNQTVNFEDPNINVACPVFSIHGNHDDPSGFGRLSSLDLLSTNGLVNYFGRWTDLTKINISPILLRKGKTQLALYGLSYIHDGRLARLFEESKVVLEQPDPETGEWFNIMVLHQNRADRGPKNFLPERILPDFINLYVWGHEHDCRIVPEANDTHGFFVTQPGSSVATSLCEGESLEKHIGLLLIHGTNFKLEPIKLKTVRPFIFNSVNLSEYYSELGLDEGDVITKIQTFVGDRIETMIKLAKEKLSDDPNQPKEPLIRLRILYSEEDQMFNYIRFGQQYNKRVANPMDMILFKKQVKRTKHDAKPFDQAAMDFVFEKVDAVEDTRVEDIVDRYFREVDESFRLEVLYPKSINELCRRLVELDDDDAAENIIKMHHEKACAHLNDNMPGEHEATDCLQQLSLTSDEIYESVLKMLDERGGRRAPPVQSPTDDHPNPSTTNRAAIAAANISVATNASIDFGQRAKAAAQKKPTAATLKTTAGSSRAALPSARGGRGGRGAGTARGAAAKTDLNISVSKTTAQPSIQNMFGTQSTRLAGRSNATSLTRAVATRQVTQYISSDSDLD